MSVGRNSVVLASETLRQLHETERIQHIRQRHKETACTDVTSPGDPRSADAFSILDDVHRVIYSYIPKVGCSSWKEALIRITNPGASGHIPGVHEPTTMLKYGFRYLASLNAWQRQRVLNNYRSFVFVRHPLDRVLSAYQDKFMRYSRFHGTYREYYAPQILRRFRPGATEAEIQEGKGVTFKEFALYVIDQHRNGRHMNIHWRPFWDLCRPCQRHYDFIGKIETMDTDADYVFRTYLGQTNPPKFPRRNAKWSQNALRHFQQLDQNELDALIDVYKKDFEIFGYEKTIPV